MDSKKKKTTDTDHLSIYDLPTLNSVIDQYEPPQAKGTDPESGTGTVSGNQ